MRVPQFKTYLFDVDGTLVDSAADICGAIQSVLAATAQNQVPDEFLRGYIGRHLSDLFRDLFPDYTDAQCEPMMLEYRKLYLARSHSSTRPYEHTKRVLATLGGRKSTATTKSTQTTRNVLELFDLLQYFDHVQGTDGFPAKPRPDVVFRALDALGASKEECLFVGDSAADMEAARRAGVKSCAVTYGYGKREDMAHWEPDYWIDDLRELVA